MNRKDRISNLPESVLSHILSLLPTEDAVRTSVLSRKWKYKWACIYKVTFNDRKDYYGWYYGRLRKLPKRPRKTDFLNFVDRVLDLCKNSTLEEFHLLLSEYKYDLFCTKTWITAALSANAQRLCISYRGDLDFPCLFTSDSLRKLELKFCKFRIPVNTCYSNLRTLDIHDVEFQNDDSSSHLTFTFPVIEKFLSSGCKWWNVKLLRIEAPGLARFEMTGSTFECVNDGSNDCKIEIFGGNLSEFKCSVDKFANFYFSNPSRIVNVCLQYPCIQYPNLRFRKPFRNGYEPFRNGYDDLTLRGDVGNRACMILIKLSAFMRFLELSTDLVKVLADTEPACPLPIFDKLTHLKVYSVRMIIQCDSALINFLKMAPALESLTFTGSFWSKAAGNYDQIELLPGNFLPFLKVIKLEYYSDPGRLLVSPLVKFFLRHALGLKELLIYSERDGHKVTDQVKDLLLKRPRDSGHVSILSM